MNTDRNPVILVVERDAEVRSRMAHWVNQRGHPCLTCPGPQSPEYLCPGTQGSCSLADAADICVLDMEMSSDLALKGTSGWEILFAYLAIGKTVIALVGENDPTHPAADDGRVVVLPRPVEREDLFAALDAILQRRHYVEARSPSGDGD